MSGGPPPKSHKPATVRYYFDADLLGLGKIVAGLRSDTTYPGDPGATIKKRIRPVCPVASTSVPDHEWIPIVASRGWITITRDRHIRERPAELAAVRSSGARLFVLTSRENLSIWDQLEVLMRQWSAIESAATAPGPFIYAVGRSGLSRLPL
jgi:hypothetical protein